MNLLSEYVDFKTLELLSDGIVIYRAVGEAELLYANKVALEIFECADFAEMKKACNNGYLNFMHHDDYRHHATTIAMAWQAQEGVGHHVQYRVVTPAKHIKLLDDSGRALEVPGYGRCYLCTLSSLDTQIRYGFDVKDPLTGLLSMGQFIRYCESFLKSPSVRKEANLYHIAYFNIHDFRQFNIEFGFQRGDSVLVGLGKIIMKQSTTKVVARIGGDQFAAISKSQEMHDRIHNVIDEFAFEYGAYGLSVDVGVYQISGPEQDIHVACDLAKTACDSIYASKESLAVYNNELSRKIHVANYVLQHFEEALQKEYLQVYYQPVVRTLTGSICGMEALARWIDPEIGFLSPGDFISVLEEKRLITKLDLYILDKICQDFVVHANMGKPLVPVSVNLSRIGFLDYDIFTEVDSIVRKYKLPKYMINIEVTESMVMGDLDSFRKTVDRFRNAGYQIWMDDFGSGYSSLNVLKNFSFDEIKLDMKFMDGFDEASKTIIMATVVMAKKLGIQTLAEGVETQEQYDFLCSIGCEKVQGYLISKPVPLSGIKKLVDVDGVALEDRRWRNYYDRLGAVNLITERTRALVEYDGRNFNFLFMNDAFKQVCVETGSPGFAEVYEIVNSDSSPLGRSIRNWQKALKPEDGKQEMTVSANGRMIRLDAVCLTQNENRSAYMVEITNLSASREEEEKRDLVQEVCNTMYALYDSVYLCNLATGKFTTLLRGTSSDVKAYNEFHNAQVMNPQMAAELFIHPNERREYLEFIDKTTLVERIRSSEKGYLSRYFRTLTKNGAYIWKAHILMLFDKKDSVIYCSRTVEIDQPKLLARMNTSFPAEQGNGMSNVVKSTMQNSKVVNIFWKDAERRFIGVNDKFLQTYGFSDVSAVFGKTDEEMGWHVDGDSFEDDEWRVLRKGEVLTNRLGTCIINGVMHHILASKEPMYEGGKIVGLLGTFINVDDVYDADGKMLAGSNIDLLSGLLSPVGLKDAVSAYEESWNKNKENFAVIRMYVPRFYYTCKLYGDDTARKMLKEIGNIFAGYCGSKATCGRLVATDFVALVKCRDKEVVRKAVAAAKADLEGRKMLLGYSATMYPNVAIRFADEAQDVRQLAKWATEVIYQEEAY